MKKSLLFLMMLLCTVASKAVTITEVGGWFESGYVTWEKTSGLEYNVYVSPASYDSWTKLDDELVREYPTYGRADALGLTAGSYKFKVVPVSNGEEVAGDAAISSSFEVKAHDRSGFAHKQAGSEGIGAYNNDGTLKSNARVVYVWANNAKTVSMERRLPTQVFSKLSVVIRKVVAVLHTRHAPYVFVSSVLSKIPIWTNS